MDTPETGDSVQDKGPNDDAVHQDESAQPLDQPSDTANDGASASWIGPRLGVLAVAIGCTMAMAIALYLPWSASGGHTHSLADYGAPQPAVVAWGLLALGLSTAIITVLAQVLGGRGSFHAVAAGGALYFTGAIVWYGSSILPAVVASGCSSNGGPACSSAPTSPTVPQTVGSGFVLGLTASLVLIAVGIISGRVLSAPGDSPEG